jgi:pyruvate dehydrogenase E1 component beta subunit
MDQIVNQAAKIHFMLGGELSVPMVLRAPSGSGTGAAAQHSQSLESWFAHVPGLKVVLPSSPADAKGLLLAALDDPNPVIVLEHKLLYKNSGHVPQEMYRTPIGVSNTVREGSDLTIVATGVMVSRSLEAAAQLASQGIEAAVIDVRTLSPLDMDPINASVANTGRLMLVQEAPKHVGFMAEVAARVAEGPAIYSLTEPVARLCGLDVPIPYAPQLEKAVVPQLDDIVEGAKNMMRGV